MTDQNIIREEQQQEGGPSTMASPFPSFGSLRIPSEHNNNDNDDSALQLQVDRSHSMDEINISTEMERENDRLKEELAMMKNQMMRMRTKLKEQQQYISSSQQSQQQQQPLNASENSKHQKSSSTAGVLLELPVTMRNSTNSKLKTSAQKPAQEQASQGLLSCMSRKPAAAVNTTSSTTKIQIPHGNGNAREKDHSSVSTADDRSTLEAPIDLEAHQSAAGLHHRHMNHEKLKTNHSTTQTLKTGPTADDSLSSSEAVYDDDEMDGLVRVATSTEAAPTTVTNPEVGEQMTFCKSVADRAGWLVGLLVFQSLSSFILARNESLLQHHAVIVQFLTMLVGAGGNAGNQASVGVVRGLAVGTINRSNVRRFLRREFAMGICLSIILGVAGCIRAAVFAVPFLETIAITSSLFMIVIISVVTGALLPLGMQIVGIDPAHSSTTIQVIMDITGVVITVHVSSLVLDSDFRKILEHAMSLEGETR